MKNAIIILLILLGSCALGQQNNDADENIYIIMDENATELFKTSKAYSVSIGIVKDGKIYTKHYGEIDKGKGNRADDNTYFEAASVTKAFTGYLIAKAALDALNVENTPDRNLTFKIDSWRTKNNLT